MKRILAIFLSILIIFSFAACENSEETQVIEKEEKYVETIGNFIVISKDTEGSPDCYLVYDEDTYVMYSIIFNFITRVESGITITPLYNADGSLRIYNETQY